MECRFDEVMTSLDKEETKRESEDNKIWIHSRKMNQELADTKTEFKVYIEQNKTNFKWLRWVVPVSTILGSAIGSALPDLLKWAATFKGG